MTNAERKTALWTPTYISLLVIGAITSTSFNTIHPMISKYATSLGAEVGIAGIIAGLFSITALFGRPFGAFIVDRMNKKYVLVAAISVMGLASLGYSISKNIPLLVIFRILHGAAFAVSGTSTMALIASIVPRDNLGEAIGYYGMSHIIATALGPNIGIYITNTYSYRVNFLSSGIILLVAAGLLSRLPYSWSRPTNTENNKKISIGDLISIKILPLAFIGGIFSFTNGIVSSFLVLLGEERGIKNIGLYFTVLSVCLFFIRPIFGKLSDRKGLAFILYPAFFLVALESILLSHASVLLVVLLAAIAKAFGQGSAQPSIQAACLKKLEPSKSGLAAATYYIGADIGQGIGPMIGGAISQAYSYSEMFYFCVFLLFLGAIGFTVYNKREISLQRELEKSHVAQEVNS